MTGFRRLLARFCDGFAQEMAGVFRPAVGGCAKWGADWAIALLLFLTAFIGYAVPALRLAQGRYFEFYNLAFDYDPYRVLSVLTLSPPDMFGFKHPLMLLLRPLGLGVMALGWEAKPAAALVMAATGAGTVALVWAFLRSAGIARPEAAALVLLFAVSATQIFTAIITETYGFALFSIVLVWLLALRRMRNGGKAGWSVAAGVLALGVTVTNVVQPIFAALTLGWARGGPVRGLGSAGAQGVLIGLGAGVLVLAVWHMELLDAARDPMGAAKSIWWLQTKGPTTGVGPVLQAFFGFSFVSPEWSFVRLPETTNMRDFRDWVFSATGTWAVLGWLMFWVVGTLAGLAQAAWRPIALGLLATLIFNTLFHMGFQYRGSVVIYAAHVHFLIFALGTGLAQLAARYPAARVPFVGLVLTLAALVAAVNIPVVMEFAAAFDVPDTSCLAPCIDGLR